MIIYVDGDAFPNLLKPILTKAIIRLKIETTVVTNKYVSIGKSKFISYKYVSTRPDEADNVIVDCVQEGDLVITADIPLADRVISKKAHVLDHRGRIFTSDNIKQHLAVRNLMQDIRDSGEITKGPAPFNKKDVQNFANKLDQFLVKHCRL